MLYHFFPLFTCAMKKMNGKFGIEQRTQDGRKEWARGGMALMTMEKIEEFVGIVGDGGNSGGGNDDDDQGPGPHTRTARQRQQNANNDKKFEKEADNGREMRRRRRRSVIRRRRRDRSETL